MIDITLRTPSRSTLLDLMAICDLSAESLGVRSSIAGIALDYFGPVVAAPAILSHSEFPPVVLTPAVFLPGEYAALRFTGDDSEANATLLLMALEGSEVTLSDLPHRWYDHV